MAHTRKAPQLQANHADTTFSTNSAYPKWNKDFVLSTLLNDAIPEKPLTPVRWAVEPNFQAAANLRLSNIVCKGIDHSLGP
jgi:hypothetical protein